ncbi:MAG TPA: glycosyltransferase family 39 protein [Candidatus Paceibacterota bacterium]|nr:glycosyltransferase family 39 protein [Candidatus Paceibacterota bacterium]
MKRNELLVLLLILAIASWFRLAGLHDTPPGLYPDEAMVGNEAINAWNTKTFSVFYPYNNGEEGLYADIASIPIHFLGNTAFSLRLVSAIAGILTVLGVYLLARRMFDSWELAAMAAFFLATGFWHVNFSRIGFRAILAPMFAVWGFYELYKGLETNRIWHWVLAGVSFGLGMYTYIAFRVMPLAILLVLGAYWLALSAAFSHGKFAFVRHQLAGGVAAMIGVGILVCLPIAAYFVGHPADFVGRTSQISVFSTSNPVMTVAVNTVKTLGMFFLAGDSNWRHNISGAPILFWPVAALFAAGLVHTLWRFYDSWRKRGHPGVVQTLLLSWFLIGLIPEIFSNEGIPHALRSIIDAPVVAIISAVGLHWLTVWLRKWYAMRDTHKICLPGPRGHRWCVGEGSLVVGISVISLLFAIGVAEANRYFVTWAQDPNVPGAFNENYADIARHINSLPPATLKYVIVNAGGVLVNGIPMPAQTVMYLTDTWTPADQAAHHVVYLLPEQVASTRIPRGAAVFSIDP